jgi:hypothetical protein
MHAVQIAAPRATRYRPIGGRGESCCYASTPTCPRFVDRSASKVFSTVAMSGRLVRIIPSSRLRSSDGGERFSESMNIGLSSATMVSACTYGLVMMMTLTPSLARALDTADRSEVIRRTVTPLHGGREVGFDACTFDLLLIRSRVWRAPSIKEGKRARELIGLMTRSLGLTDSTLRFQSAWKMSLQVARRHCYDRQVRTPGSIQRRWT